MPPSESPSSDQLERLSVLGGEKLPSTRAHAERLIGAREMWVNDPASDRQNARLRWLGFNSNTLRLTRSQASDWLDRLINDSNSNEWKEWKANRVARGLRDVPYAWELDSLFGPAVRDESEAPTLKQIEYLASLGANRLPDTKREASALIDTLRGARQANDRVLARLKFNDYMGPLFPLNADVAFSLLSDLIARVEKPGSWEAFKQQRQADGLRDVPYPWELNDGRLRKSPLPEQLEKAQAHRGWLRYKIGLRLAVICLACYLIWTALVWLYTSGIILVLGVLVLTFVGVWCAWIWDKRQKIKRRELLGRKNGT